MGAVRTIETYLSSEERKCFVELQEARRWIKKVV